ncbi:hypothetical protein N007_11850 [Alicyclobacillus acidoterrestris ATCC 49025]|nr:hypothetical protein N007_11850 [Alicyclobacillus acidoterrestris ATCC 49025]
MVYTERLSDGIGYIRHRVQQPRLVAVHQPGTSLGARGVKTTRMAKRKHKPTRSLATLSRKLRSEAKALGMSEDEYLRLTLSLSKALRESLGSTKELNAKQFLNFVESPMFAILLKGIVQTAMSTFTQKSDDGSENPTEDETKPNPYGPMQPIQPPVPAQPGSPRRAPIPQWGYGYPPSQPTRPREPVVPQFTPPVRQPVQPAQPSAGRPFWP